MDTKLLAPQLQKIQSLSQFMSDIALAARLQLDSPETMNAATESLCATMLGLTDAINEMNNNVNELDQ